MRFPTRRRAYPDPATFDPEIRIQMSISQVERLRAIANADDALLADTALSLLMDGLVWREKAIARLRERAQQPKENDE